MGSGVDRAHGGPTGSRARARCTPAMPSACCGGVVERDARLDPPSRTVRRLVHRVVPDGPLKDLLSGTWLGHPLHPMLTDLPIGFWTSVWVLDILGPRSTATLYVALVGLGVLSASSRRDDGRVGLGRHDRLRDAARPGARGGERIGRRALPRLVDRPATAATPAGASRSAWPVPRPRPVGGFSVASRAGPRLGVDANLAATGPDDWTWSSPRSTCSASSPYAARRGGVAPSCSATGAEPLVALAATCPHRGAPMDEGTVVDDCVECPWHGSRFRMPDGALARGPAASPLPRFEFANVTA